MLLAKAALEGLEAGSVHLFKVVLLLLLSIFARDIICWRASDRSLCCYCRNPNESNREHGLVEKAPSVARGHPFEQRRQRDQEVEVAGECAFLADPRIGARLSGSGGATGGWSPRAEALVVVLFCRSSSNYATGS